MSLSSFLPACLIPGLLILLGASPVPAQSISVIPTVVHGTPFRGSDVLGRLTTGESISLNVMLDTRDTGIFTDAITVNLRFRHGILTKLIRKDFQGPGQGWPLEDGIPILSSRAELPLPLQEHVGLPFFTVSGSTENPDCPCDAQNGEGMEAVSHFLLVDVQRRVKLPPGLYHLFQTDWVVTQDCSIPDFEIEVTDGPGSGLQGLGTPSRNFLYDDFTEIAHDLGGTLEASTPPPLELHCRALLRFLRGDTNLDQVPDITDTVNILGYLFLGKPILCEAAADTDDNGSVELTDAIYLIRYLFLSGDPIPGPFPTCGTAPRRNEFLCQFPCS